MSLETRLWDSEVFSLPGSPDPEPHFTVVLLIQLGCLDAPKKEQAAAVAEWLKTHKPSESLSRDLRDEGFSETLAAHAAA